jgi:integrase
MTNIIPLLRSVRGKVFDPKNFRRHFDEVRKLAKVKNWSNNILRHTAASYLYALTHDDQFVTNNLGHSLAVNKKHYQHLVSPNQGIEFFRIGIENKEENSLKIAI